MSLASSNATGSSSSSTGRRRRRTTTSGRRPRARPSDLGLDSSMLEEFNIRESSSSEDDEDIGTASNTSQLTPLTPAGKRPAPSAVGTTAMHVMRARAMELEVNAILNHSTNEKGHGDDDGALGGDVPKVLTSTTATDTGCSSSGASASAESVSGHHQAALHDNELDAMLSDLVGRRSGGSGRHSNSGNPRRKTSSSRGAPTSVFALNGAHNSYDDAPSVASSLGMSHDDPAQRRDTLLLSAPTDVDLSRISHTSRRSRNTRASASSIRSSPLDHKDVASLERELHASRQAVDALLRQRTERNEAEEKAHRQVASLVAEKDAMEQNRNDLREQLEAMRSSLAESDDIIDHQHELIQHNEAEVQLYEQRTAQMSDELEALRAERDDLQDELVAKSDEATSSHKKLKAAEAEILALRSEIGELRSELSDKCKDIKSSGDGRKAAEAEAAKLRAECDKLRSIEVEAESLKRDKEDLTASVGKKAELIGKLKGDLAAEKEQKRSSQHEVEALRDSNAELQTRAETLTEENESFKRQLDGLQQSFLDLRKGNEDAHAILSDLEDANSKLAVLEQSLASSEKEKECLVEAATELEDELSREKELRADADAKAKALEQESEDVRSSLQNLTDEILNERSKSSTMNKDLEDARATIVELKTELKAVRSDKEAAETDYIEVLAQLENAKAQLVDAKTDANTARTDAADGIEEFEQRLKEKLEVQLNEHEAAMEALQMQHENDTAALQRKYDESISSAALEKDNEISTLRARVMKLEQTLQRNIEDADQKEEQLAQELAQIGGWLEKSKQREEAATVELKKLRASSEDVTKQRQAAFDQRLEEELEIQRLAYESSAQTLEAQNRAQMASKVRSLQNEMQLRDAESKQVINDLISELDAAKVGIEKASAEADEANSRADQLELEAATLRETMRSLENQNAALIKGRERARSKPMATQTIPAPKESREVGCQANIADETANANTLRIEESLRQTKVELAAALTAFNLSDEETPGSNVTDGSATSISESVQLLRTLCRFVNSEGPVGDSDLENAWQSLGLLRRFVSQTNLPGAISSDGPFIVGVGGSPKITDEKKDDESTSDDDDDDDDDSILRNLTLSFDKAFAALQNGVEFIDDDDAHEGGSDAKDGTNQNESSASAAQALELVPIPAEQETSIIEFGNEKVFETEGRLGIVLGRPASPHHQHEYSIDRSNEEVAAIVKANEEMLAIVPELQMRCDFLENERDILLHEKEDLLNETLDLLETSRAESEAQIAAAVSMIRADAATEIARCKEEYQLLLTSMKYRETQKQKQGGDDEANK